MDDNKEKLVPDFPSNSYNLKQKAPETPKKKVEKVIAGDILQRKKSLGARFADTFFGGSLKIAWNYILLSVLVPTLQNLFIDTVKGGVESLVYGEKGVSNRNRNQDPNRPVVQYGGYFVNPKPNATPQQPQRSGAFIYDNLVFTGGGDLGQAKRDAENVRAGLLDILTQYPTASLADLNNLLGKTGEFTDVNWGWENLSSSSVTRVREGFLLNLPRPTFLGP